VVLTVDLKIASANLTFQSEHIPRAGADELQTQQALTYLRVFTAILFYD